MSDTAHWNVYDNPLITRYASAEMAKIWSPQHRHATWRRLWLILAEAQHELGLTITDEQLAEMRAHLEDIDFAAAARYERELRHDVMAHVHAYGDQCPTARPILHLGATSCYITDNADLLLIRESLLLILPRLVRVIDQLATFAEKHAHEPCLGFTHLQPAQPVTVGKRATLWCYDWVLDLYELEHRLLHLKLRGVKGTTGTQASFLALFAGNHRAVKELEQRVIRKLGFQEAYPVTGQTYSRKVDVQLLDLLSGIAVTAHKMGTDLRLLQSRRELEEPYESRQIGSSAMAYKRNPMRAERMCSLARLVIGLQNAMSQTAAIQWLERTLDDSALRRVVLPQAFLAIDAVLILAENIMSGLTVNSQIIRRHLEEELPFLATEEVLMAGVKAGGDRQDLHERIRLHSVAAANQLKLGQPNDLLQRLQHDPIFSQLSLAWDELLDPSRYVGRAPQQVAEFIETVITPIRQKYAAHLSTSSPRNQHEDLRV